MNLPITTLKGKQTRPTATGSGLVPTLRVGMHARTLRVLQRE
jgi:hypothetical protein